MTRYVRTAAAAPATTAARAAWTGDGLSPDIRLASAPLSTPLIAGQLRRAFGLDFSLVDLLRRPLPSPDRPLRERLAERDELGRDAAAGRLQAPRSGAGSPPPGRRPPAL